jgi:hypothetical protein
MRKPLIALLFLMMTFATSSAARAGWTIEGSVGKGGRVNEPRGWEPTNVMAVLGYQFAMLRPQLGFVADLGDVENSRFNMQLRPMFGIYPPILPLFARAIFAFQNLRGDVQMAIGGSGGIKIGLPVIGLAFFAEAGVLPRFADAGTQTIVEGRAGAYWIF